jgi:FKBP-type peptidyl-prolyl cis-trans isomerase
MRYLKYFAAMLFVCSCAMAGDAPEAPKPSDKKDAPAEKATEKEAAAIQEAIKNLGSNDFDVRQKATDELTSAGKKALPFLQAAQKETADAEVKTRAGKLVEKITMEDGIVALPSGLKYKVLKEGAGESPVATDVVVVHYAGRLENGTEFDSSYKRGQPATFPLNRVIAGWTEGLQLMKPGAKYMLIIPGKLAYGDHPPPGSGIGPGDTLIFDVELISVKGK